MTSKQWLLTCGLLIAVYLLGYITPAGNLWFAYAFTVSFFAILVILRISISTTSKILAMSELAAMVTIFLSWMHYADMIDNSFWYAQHEVIIEAIAIAQVLIMLIGSPWSGVGNRVFKQLGLGNIFCPFNRFGCKTNMAKDK